LPQEARAWNYLGLAYQKALALDHNLAAAQFNLGCLHLERADWNAAITALTTFTGLQPQSDFGWVRLGTACLRAGQLDNAERSFHRALQINNRLPEALNGLGLLRMQRKNYAEASRQFEAALRVQADHAPALLNGAIVAHQFLNDRSTALLKYQRYLALKPPPPNWTVVDRIARQLDEELHPAPRPPAAGTAPQPATAAKQAEAGKASGKRESKADGPAADAKPVAAVPSAAAPGRTGPPSGGSTVSSSPPPRPKPVVPERTKDELPSSTRDADAVPRVQPPPKAVATLPSAAGSSGSSIAPSSPGGQSKLPTPVLGAAPSTPPRSGVPRYRYQSPAAPKAGDRTQADANVAEGLRLQERYQLKEAIEKYRAAIRVDPSSFDAYYNLGVAAFEAGDLPQTLTAYEHALAVDATSRKARFNFAITLERAGYPHDAAQELERLVADHPTETRAQFNLAHLYADKLNDPQRAKAAYLRVLELDPQHPQATAVRYWLEANP
jgi:tetratricopeptide (TPR) repeat protein